ncbi:MAG: phage tail protein [Hyphomonadaceae bacterium]|nr:phage tail protein [Hyphomonadaceae bacterium]
MPPVAAAVVAVGNAIGAIAGAVGAFVGGVTGSAVLGVAAAGAVASGAKLLLQVGLNLAVNALLAPRAPAVAVAARQASVLELTLGESPRQAIFGRAATGGTLLRAFNHGPDFEWETLVIALADHRCDALEGFYVNDTYVAFTGDGLVGGDYEENGERFLRVNFHDGRPGQAASDFLRSVAPDLYGPGDNISGVAYVDVSYKVNERIWASGRPRFRFVVRGKRCYDPRLDSTVPGGSGPQRWDVPDTHVWTANAAVCHYNFVRGVWTNGQLLVGPGKSAEEAPPADVIASANVCDENIDLRGGGTEKRYAVGCVIDADEEWIAVEEHFAAAMAGDVVERAGALAIDPGTPVGVVFSFTDDDLLVGAETRYQARLPRDRLVNTVTATYVAPDQLWETATAPLRRSQADIAADGEVREETLALRYVTSGTQAQRIAEIQRRKARMQAQATVALGPRALRLEVGDAVGWTSQRYFGGEVRKFMVVAVAHDDACNVTLALRQTSVAAFAWDPAVDELEPDRPAYLPPGAAPPAALENFDAGPVEITGANGVSANGIRATWDAPPRDFSIVSVLLEYRPVGSTASTRVQVDALAGVYVIDVVPLVDVDYEIRATPVTIPRRPALTTAWRVIPLVAPVTPPVPPPAFTGYQNRDLIRFVWTPFADTSLRYEIRAGETFDLGRYVDNVAGGSTTVQWPIVSEDDEVLFWIKTVHRSGIYSADATLWVATVANLGDRNFVLAEDLQADAFPGVVHDFTPAEVGGQPVLELVAADVGLSARRGDYYAAVALVDTFRARAWIEQRASSFLNDVPAWDDTEATWDELGDADWSPDIGDPGAARLDSFIALAADPPASLIEGFRLDGDTTGINGAAPTATGGLSYAPARTAQGARIAEGGALWYALTTGAEFSLLFDVRIDALPATDRVLATFSNAAGVWLQLTWRAGAGAGVGAFELDGSDAAPVTVAATLSDDDTVSIGLWQSAAARGLGLASRRDATFRSGTAATTAAPSYTGLSLNGGSVESVAWEDTEATWDALDTSWNETTDVAPVLPAFPGVIGDVALYSGAATGAAFAARWDKRGPVGFEDYQPFIAGDYGFQQASVWLRLTAPQAFAQSLSLTRARVNVDVPDVVDSGEVSLPAEGAWVSYNRAFYGPPEPTATQRSGAARGVVVIEQRERTRFFARLYRSDLASPTGMAGAITWAANGF